MYINKTIHSNAQDQPMQRLSSKYAEMEEDAFPGMEVDNVWQSSSESETDAETQQLILEYLSANRSQNMHTLRGVTPSAGVDSMHAYQPEWSLPLDTMHTDYAVPHLPEEYYDELPKYKYNNVFPRQTEDGVSSTKYNDMPGAKKHSPMTEEEQTKLKKQQDMYWAQLMSERKKTRALSDEKRAARNHAKYHTSPAQLHTVDTHPERPAILKQFCEITGQSETKAHTVLSQHGYNLMKAVNASYY